MKFFPVAEKVLIEEVTLASQKLKQVVRGFSLGGLIKSIRLQLGMSQKNLAKRACIPQSTVSRIEQGQKDLNLSTLQKILDAMSCDLVIAPLLHQGVESIRHKQAKKLASKHMEYLKGTMNLEEQEPDSRFMAALLKQEEERLLHGPNAKLWEE